MLDAGLHVKARYRNNARTPYSPKWTAKAADMDGDGLDEILLLSDHVNILKWKR
jgi:hypothetical protein